MVFAASSIFPLDPFNEYMVIAFESVSFAGLIGMWLLFPHPTTKMTRNRGMIHV
jgi:hypothetical protein